LNLLVHVINSVRRTRSKVLSTSHASLKLLGLSVHTIMLIGHFSSPLSGAPALALIHFPYSVHNPNPNLSMSASCPTQ